MALPPPPLPSNPQARGIPTATGGQIELSMQQQMGRDLLDMLQPGQVLSGRVVERFANGSYLFTLRGRNLIADSSVPLARDSVVQFQVLESNDGLRLRLLDGSGIDKAQTSNIGSRLQQLGLPDNAAARLVVSSFEQSQAPLANASRLQQALQQVSQASPERQPTLAAAHAMLAKAGLPATPALIALAERAVGGQLPDPLAAMSRLVQGSQQLPTLPATPATGQSTATTNNAPVPAPPAAAASQAATASTNPTTPQGNAAATMPSGSGQPVQAAGRPQFVGQLDGLIQQLRLIATQIGGNSTSAGNEVLKGQTAQATDTSTQNPAPEASQHTSEAARPEVASIERDLAQQQHLRHEASTVARLALQHPDSSPELRHAAVAVAHEMGADLLLRPHALDDYDLVLPLALQQAAQPSSPARLAVAHRRTRSGETMTFLRVDLELEGLGPLSLRFNATQSGVIAITLFATGVGLNGLRSGIDDLRSDLKERGLDVSLRLSDLLEEDNGG